MTHSQIAEANAFPANSLLAKKVVLRIEQMAQTRQRLVPRLDSLDWLFHHGRWLFGFQFSRCQRGGKGTSADGRRLIDARVVKVDAANDLALLKAEGRFAPLPVAASRGVRLGSTVATVGFPATGLQGFSPKLAKAKSRRWPVARTMRVIPDQRASAAGEFGWRTRR